MTADLGVVAEGEVILGHDYYSQPFTITGGPTSGTMTFSILDETTAPVSISALAATINTAINALSYPCAQSAVFAWTSSSAFTITSGSGGGFIEPWRVAYSVSGGTNPEIVPGTPSIRPNFYTLGEGTYAQASVPPTVGKQAVPGTVADRTDQPKASEWFGRSWLPGLGRLHYRENESVERIWDANVWTHIDRQVTLPALVESETMDASAGTPYGVTNFRVGVTTAGGVRAVGMFDVTGLTTSGNPVYYDASTQTWQIIPSASTLSSDTAICGIIFYGGYVYMSYTNATQTKRGYLYWDGVGGGTSAVTVDTTDAVVVLDFEEWDGKLFRLLSNGKLQWASVSSGAIAEADWVPTTNTPKYFGPGYAYALKNFTDRSGALILHIIATDGLYQFDFENWRIVRAKEVNGPSVLAPSVYPQPNSVTEHNGDLYWVHGDTVRKYDGSIISDIGPAIDDGLPERGLAFSSALRPRALFSTNNMLLCAMSRPVENVAATTLSSDTTISVLTTYYTTLTITLTNTLTINDELDILDPVDDLGCVLGFNGQGWHVIVPMTASTTSAPFTTRAILYHELHNIPRLLFAPGKFIRWRDKPSNPLFWSDMLWDTTTARYMVTSWLDLDLTDITKLLLFLRIGYRNAGNGCTITPYFQINGVDDTGTFTVGYDPAQHFVQMVDLNGTAMVIGDGDDAVTDVAKAFFDRTTHPALGSHGLQAREVRLVFKFASTDSSRTPMLDFFSSPLIAKFDALFSFPIPGGIQITPNGDKDGRSAERQFNDLMATYLSKNIIDANFGRGWIKVMLDFFNAAGLSSGAQIDAKNPPRVGGTLSEWTRF